MYSVLPVYWRKQWVHTAKVDDTLYPILDMRRWHISNTKHAASPRTSFNIGTKQYHLLLHKAVAVLNSMERCERAYFWLDLQNIMKLASSTPNLAFKDNDAFNCTVENILLCGSKSVTVENLKITASESILPLEALLPRKASLNCESFTPDSMLSADQRAASETVRKVIQEAPPLPHKLSPFDEDNTEMLNDVFNILSIKPAEGEQNHPQH